MGAGKTAVLGEASDLLAQHRVVHAAIDVDALGLAHLETGAASDYVMYENLRSICANYASHIVQRFLVARAVENTSQLSLIRAAIPAENTVVCRLTASLEEMKRRVATRETGIMKANYLARIHELDGLLDRARLENFTVSNENRSVTDVALEMLVNAGWIAG